jgi:hypothetical protein
MALLERFRGQSVADIISVVAAEQPRHPLFDPRDRRLSYGQVDAHPARSPARSRAGDREG